MKRGTQRKNVAPWLGVALQLLWRGKAIRDNDHRFILRTQAAGNTKIDQFHPIIGADHDVRRLEVAKDDPLMMQVAQHFAELRAPTPHALFGLDALLLHDLGKVAPMHKIHDEIVAPAFFKRIAHTGNGGMIQIVQHARFALEPIHDLLAIFGIGKGIEHFFDGAGTFEVLIFRFVDRAHAAQCHDPSDAIAVVPQQIARGQARGYLLLFDLGA